MQDHLNFTTGDGVRLAYRIDGPAEHPLLVLSNSIGTSMAMWDAQIAPFTHHFRVLRYDTRGHGGSDVPPGPYSFDRLGRDVLELLDALGIGQVHFLGLSLGGIIAQWLAVHAPERIGRLVLSNTAAWLGPAPQWDERIRTAMQASDMRAIAEMFLENWFPAAMLAQPSATVDKFRAMLLATAPLGLAGAYAAVRDGDFRRTAALIEAPALVIAGRDDTVTSLRHGGELAAAIPLARLQVFPTVHLTNVELPEQFNEAVITFLRADGHGA